MRSNVQPFTLGVFAHAHRQEQRYADRDHAGGNRGADYAPAGLSGDEVAQKNFEGFVRCITLDRVVRLRECAGGAPLLCRQLGKLGTVGLQQVIG